MRQKVELILLAYGNAVLDAQRGATNPKLGELIDPPVQEIMELFENSTPHNCVFNDEACACDCTDRSQNGKFV